MGNQTKHEQNSAAKIHPRFDHFVAELLRSNDGVFFGELHSRPSLRQSITKLLPYFKANGLETISIEQPQNLIDEMKTFTDIAEMKKRWPRASEALLGHFEVVKAAQKLGLHVIGHEVPMPKGLEKSLVSEQKGEADVLEARLWWAGSEKGVKERDDFAAAHIRANRKGKYLVIGGSDHSGNYTKADMDDPERETKDGYIKGIDTHSSYQGIDFKLGIPSIDYIKAYPEDLVGVVNKTNGRFNTYEVALPEAVLGSFYPSILPNCPKPPNLKR